MKKKLLLSVLLPLLASGGMTAAEVELVKITPEMVINESGSGNAMQWFDEQDASATPVTRWVNSGNTNCWPAGVVIDLGQDYEIDRISLFDGEKAYRVEGGQVEIAVGVPFSWKEVSRYEVKNTGSWATIAIGQRTRYLHLVKHATVMCNLDGEFPENCDVNIGEVMVYGRPIGRPHKAKKPHGKRPEPVTMDRFIGMNSYINTDERLYDAVGTIREYRPWAWNGVDDVSKPISWDPMNVGDGDKYYAHMKALGIDCMPCIHRHVLRESSEQIPTFGADPHLPETYRVMADYSFQFVARYGSSHVSPHLLRTTEAAPKKSGLGYIRYFENWNEQNREWGDPMCHFSPYMFAAFSSASYDGHRSTMGPGIGVKAADKKMNYVMGGLAGLSLEYIRAMKLWSDYHRGGSFPADVLNVHHYCNTRGRQHPGVPAHGISPEADHLDQRLERLTAWRDQNLPDKELWLTEIGWDTDTISYQSAGQGHALFPEHIGMQEIQAQWLTRTFLIASATGVDRVMMYLANDIKGYIAPVYGRCGLLTIDDELKTSYYYLRTMREVLRGMTFDSVVTKNDSVWIYRYKDKKTKREAYVLWSPTSDGSHLSGYPLPINKKKGATVTQVRLQDKAKSGVKSTLEVVEGKVCVDVDERPLFVVVD